MSARKAPASTPADHAAAARLGLGLLRWPEDVAAVLGVGVSTLDACRANGDHPRLCVIGSRAMFVTADALKAWVQSRAVPTGYKAREATTRTSGGRKAVPA